jgi:uncharacterized protein YebE (UPF0316 family)
MLLKLILIFLARICDVSLGTVKTVSFVKGKTIEPFVFAFFEVFIWYLMAREALSTDGNRVLIAIAYAGGYATGTLIGTKLSGVLVKGIVGVQTVIKDGSVELVDMLRKKGYGVSVIELKETYSDQEKDMLYIQVNSDKLKEVTKLIKAYDKEAFIVVNETKYVQNGLIK